MPNYVGFSTKASAKAKQSRLAKEGKRYTVKKLSAHSYCVEVYG